MYRLAFLLAVLLLFSGSRTVAQTLLLEPGTRVRVTGCGSRNGRHQGSFDELRGDTLFLRIEAAVTACPLSSLAGLDVSAGQSSRWKRGAVIGGIAAGVPMAGLVALACYALDESAEGCRPGEAAVGAAVGLAIGAAGGGLIGGAIGLLIKTEKWERVRIHPPSLLVRISPSGRTDLALAMQVSKWGEHSPPTNRPGAAIRRLFR